MEVHRSLGCGFLEVVYGDALELELSTRGIPFEREKQIFVEYKGMRLNHKYCADFVCYGDIIVEIKALNELSSAHHSQIINYLKATNNKIGLLINFGEQHLVYKRFANNKNNLR